MTVPVSLLGALVQHEDEHSALDYDLPLSLCPDVQWTDKVQLSQILW